MSLMSEPTTEDRASAEVVRAHAQALRDAAHQAGLTHVRLRDDVALVMHATEPGYRQVINLVGRARAITGATSTSSPTTAPVSKARGPCERR